MFLHERTGEPGLKWPTEAGWYWVEAPNIRVCPKFLEVVFVAEDIIQLVEEGQSISAWRGCAALDRARFYPARRIDLYGSAAAERGVMM